MQNFRANKPITYVANGLHGPHNRPQTAGTLTNFDAIDRDADSYNSVYVFLRDDNANEVDYTTWRTRSSGTRLASKHRVAFGLALAKPFEEPTIYEYAIAGFTDSKVELIPFVGQLHHDPSAGSHQDGLPHAWDGSQDIATDNSGTPYNLCFYHLLPLQHDKGFSASAAGKIAMHESYGPHFTGGVDDSMIGTFNGTVILGVIAFNDETSAQLMLNTDISISGRRLPQSETVITYKDRRP